MNSDFKDVMSKHTDEALIKIVTIERDCYQPLAIEAAEAEIKVRNINAVQIQQMIETLEAETSERAFLNSKTVASSIRLVHYIVDTMTCTLFTAIILIVYKTFLIGYGFSVGPVLNYLIFGIVFLSYYVFMEATFQKTLGKFITRTKVVNADGSTADIGAILRRTLCRLIPFDSLSFLLSPNGLHDQFSDTTLIRDEY